MLLNKMKFNKLWLLLLLGPGNDLFGILAKLDLSQTSQILYETRRSSSTSCCAMPLECLSLRIELDVEIGTRRSCF